MEAARASCERTMKLDAFGHSDPGRQREANEDNYLCLRPVPDQDVYLLAVADGMGGHAGGATASDIAVTRLRSGIAAHLGSRDSKEASWQALARTFDDINRAIREASHGREELRGMGTTLVTAVVADGRATIGSVGDSRCYHLRAGDLVQVTEDHSWAAEQQRQGKLSADQIAASPFRGTITRALGFDERAEPDLFQVTLGPGDALLLCSDGMHGLLTDAEIGRIARRSDGAEALCRRLIERSNEAGGTDNITAVAALVAGTGGSSSETREIRVDGDSHGAPANDR